MLCVQKPNNVHKNSDTTCSIVDYHRNQTQTLFENIWIGLTYS